VKGSTRASRRSRSRARKSSDTERGGRPQWPTIAVVLVAVASSIAAIGNAFTGDDTPVIRDNALVHSLSNAGAMLTSPYWPPPAPPDLYRPLASLLFAMQWAIGDGSPVVFRALSIALYAAASAGVFALARRMLPDTMALGAALLFAAHPVHTEAVALGVNQGELIVGVISAIAVARYIDGRRGHGVSRANWVVIGLMYAAGALVKENALVLPALLLAAELLLVLDVPVSTRARSLWPGYASLIGIAAIVLALRSTVLAGRVAGSFTAEALVGLDAGRRALTMLQVVPEWLRLLVWPAHLRIDYSPGEFVAATGFGFRELLGIALIAGVVAAVTASWRRAPVIAFGLAWCAISLLPVSNVLVRTGVLIGERTLFLPSIGIVIAVGGAVDLLLRRNSTTLVSRTLAAAAAALVLSGAVRSASRLRIWRDPQTLAFASVRDAPRSWRVQRAYGEALFDAGRPTDAMTAYAHAFTWAPEPWFLRNSLSRRLRVLGDESDAAAQLEESLRQRPGQREATAELTAVWLALGRYSDARRIADSVIVADAAPPIMVWMRRVADSAAAVHAPPGSIKVGIRGP